MDRTIDYTPLFAPVSKHEISEYRQRSTPYSAMQSSGIRIVAIVLVGGFALAIVVSVIGPFLLLAVSGLLSGEPLSGVGIVVPLMVLGVVVFAVWRIIRGHAPRWEQRVRMHRFANANGFVYERSSPAPAYPGAIFGHGKSRAVSDHFRTVEGRFLDFGNYRYVTGSGRNSRTHTWGFLALELDRALPHMLLDARANNGMFGASNLPSAFRRDQVLSLEGDFDRYFTLYCPRQYERDALYVFTPDLMALLIDEAAPYDIEILDRWLFVYAAKPFPLADAHTYQRLLRIVSTVGRKALSRTDRYRDERIGDFAANIVAPAGQRLRTSVPLATVVIIGAVVTFWTLTVVGDLLGG